MVIVMARQTDQSIIRCDVGISEHHDHGDTVAMMIRAMGLKPLYRVNVRRRKLQFPVIESSPGVSPGHSVEGG